MPTCQAQPRGHKLTVASPGCGAESATEKTWRALSTLRLVDAERAVEGWMSGDQSQAHISCLFGAWYAGSHQAAQQAGTASRTDDCAY